MRAQRQLQRAIILDHLAPLGHWPKRGHGFEPLGREPGLASICRREQGERRLAKTPHLPQTLPPVFGEAGEAIGFGNAFDCGARDPGAPPHIFDAIERHIAARADDCGAMDIGEAAHLAEAETNREIRRSEEHTSELQSLMSISYAVFCLKKKKKNITT